MERAALFIDGANISTTAKLLGMEIDYEKLLAVFSQEFRIIRAYYYTALVTEADGNIHRKRMVDWMSHHGYTVVTKRAKVYINDGVRRVKGNMDMEMAVDLLKVAHTLDRIILFTGDGDFTCMMQYIQENHGTQFTVVSTTRTQPPMVAEELRKQADNYQDIASLRDRIAKSTVERIDLVSRLKRG